MIKQFVLTGVLVLLIGFLLSACSSLSDETLSSPSSSQSAAAVPGEKLSGDEAYAPGPTGTGGSVRW